MRSRAVVRVALCILWFGIVGDHEATTAHVDVMIRFRVFAELIVALYVTARRIRIRMIEFASGVGRRFDASRGAASSRGAAPHALQPLSGYCTHGPVELGIYLACGKDQLHQGEFSAHLV
jgi:hypothetical protein